MVTIEDSKMLANNILVITSHHECGDYALKVAKRLVAAGLLVRVDNAIDDSFESYRRRIVNAPERIRILISGYENSNSKVTIGIRNYYYKVFVVDLCDLEETVNCLQVLFAGPLIQSQ